MVTSCRLAGLSRSSWYYEQKASEMKRMYGSSATAYPMAYERTLYMLAAFLTNRVVGKGAA